MPLTGFLFVWISAVCTSAALQPCFGNPPLRLHARESVLSAILDPAWVKPCLAEVYFDSFSLSTPRLRYTFRPLVCDGRQVATFALPPNIPDGAANIKWQCHSTESYCISVMISGGNAGFPRNTEIEGTVTCTGEPLANKTIFLTSVNPGTPPSLTRTKAGRFPMQNTTNSMCATAFSTPSGSLLGWHLPSSNNATKLVHPTSALARPRQNGTIIIAPTAKPPARPTDAALFNGSISNGHGPLTQAILLGITVMGMRLISAYCALVL